MKVRQLIATLKTLPPNADVIVSSDEEGNSFQDLYEVTHEAMEKAGRFYEPTEGKPNAIVLWPA